MPIKKIFYTGDTHYKYLHKMVETKPSRVFISTYGFYGGGGPASSAVVSLLNYLTNTGVKVDVLIGVPRLNTFKSQNAYYDYVVRLKKSTRRWREVNWRFSSANHLKLVGFAKGAKLLSCVVGGRNLTDGKSTDLSMAITGASLKSIEKFFYKHFNAASKSI